MNAIKSFINKTSKYKESNFTGDDDDDKEEIEVTDEEMEEIQEKLINHGVYPLSLIYLHPIETKLIVQQLIGVWFTCWVLALYYWTVKYIFLMPVDIVVLTALISSFGLYTLALLKVIPIVYYNSIIRRLLKSRENFWNAKDPKLKRLIYKTYASAVFYGNVFVGLVFLTLAMFMARPVYDPGTVLTLQWFAEEYYWHALAYQTVFALFLVCMVLGFNGLFLCTITHMRAQFLILNWTIQHHDNNGSASDIQALIRFVNHHRFLLSYVKDIEKVFMIQLLALYCLTIASCCMELYAITETPSTLNDKARCCIYVTSLLVQLSMFCFPAGELTSEILLMSESLYLANWEQGSRALQTWLPFAIHATQQVVDFKALGLVTINKMAFVDVGKSTLSFLTLMKNMND